LQRATRAIVPKSAPTSRRERGPGLGFLQEIREAAGLSPYWKSARERLRENPDAAVLRHLVAEFDGLLNNPLVDPNLPAAPA
jgi:hypothetical protein